MSDIAMTNEEKNRFIVEEVLGKCWHENIRKDCYRNYEPNCSCGFEALSHSDWMKHQKLNFNYYSSDPDEQAINFFRLWNCIKKKEWFEGFLFIRITKESGILISGEMLAQASIPQALINCSALADAVVEYRKGESRG